LSLVPILSQSDFGWCAIPDIGVCLSSQRSVSNIQYVKPFQEISMWTGRFVMIGIFFIAVSMSFPLFAAPQDDAKKKVGGQWHELFTTDGVPDGWVVTEWSDVSKRVDDAPWKVVGGVLSPSERRGTWLMSKEQYGDFILELEIKLTELGNSGIALRTPLSRDPAFEGLEFQVADVRYNPEAKESELTGGIYRAIAPSKQIYKPTEWNQIRLELCRSHLKAILNGETIQDINLDEFKEAVLRHDGTEAPPIAKRPRKGHIGFQHLSRDGKVEIRNVRIRKINS
jgi:hypothetical protein